MGTSRLPDKFLRNCAALGHPRYSVELAYAGSQSMTYRPLSANGSFRLSDRVLPENTCRSSVAVATATRILFRQIGTRAPARGSWPGRHQASALSHEHRRPV